MLIGGLLPYSLSDWSGRVAAVVFTRGCNFRCPWCHNPRLVLPQGEEDSPTEDDVLVFLRSRRSVLDGVVISGGEPTLQEGLPTFLEAARGLGLDVKLYTNGSRPDVLRLLQREGLVQALSVDYKALLADYPVLVRAPGDPLPEALALLAHFPGEVRTTVVPGLHTNTYLSRMAAELARLVPLDKINWVRQPFYRPTDGVLIDYLTREDAQGEEIPPDSG